MYRNNPPKSAGNGNCYCGCRSLPCLALPVILRVIGAGGGGSARGSHVVCQLVETQSLDSPRKHIVLTTFGVRQVRLSHVQRLAPADHWEHRRLPGNPGRERNGRAYRSRGCPKALD